MGVLKYALLGLLHRGDMTGYDLSKAFEGPLREFWTAQHSQIYPELRSLTKNGFVEYRMEVSGSILEKKVYSLTQAGKNEFLQWAETPEPMKATPKDEFKLQLFFSDCISNNDRMKLLQFQLEQHSCRLAYLENNLKNFESDPPDEDQEFSDYLVLLGAISREEACCGWLNNCLDLCRKWENKNSEAKQATGIDQ